MSDAASWSERHAVAATSWDTTPDEFVVAACRRLRPGAALDLGAGEGANAIWLAGRGWRVTAVERASVAVGRIQGRSALLNRPVDAIVGDAAAFVPAPEAFDLILMSYLELPEPQLRAALANSVTGLAAGGMVLVVGCDAATLDTGWTEAGDPDLLTTSDHLAHLLVDLGLVVRRADLVRRDVPAEVGFHTLLDHVVEAVRPAA